MKTLISFGYTNEISISRKECAVERHGVECRGICSGHCKGNIICNHVTGQCDGGCVVGWKGSLCNKGKFIGCFGFGVILSLLKKKVIRHSKTCKRLSSFAHTCIFPNIGSLKIFLK